jgi:hypothetical protein
LTFFAKPRASWSPAGFTSLKTVLNSIHYVCLAVQLDHVNGMDKVRPE